MFSASSSQVIIFFQFLMNSNAKWRFGTFNSCRSALTLILPESTMNDIRLRRFFKGIQKCRPKKPKYNFSWDPKLVIDFLSTMFPNEELSLLNKNKKLVTLLALISGHRLQTISSIKVNNIVITCVGIQIFIEDFIKSTHLGVEQPVIQIPVFSDMPRV